MNAGKIIKLTDGTTIEAKMNFGTIFYLDQIGGSKLGRRIDKLEKIGKATTAINEFCSKAYLAGKKQWEKSVHLMKHLQACATGSIRTS